MDSNSDQVECLNELGKHKYVSVDVVDNGIVDVESNETLEGKGFVVIAFVFDPGRELELLVSSYVSIEGKVMISAQG